LFWPVDKHKLATHEFTASHSQDGLGHDNFFVDGFFGVFHGLHTACIDKRPFDACLIDGRDALPSFERRSGYASRPKTRSSQRSDVLLPSWDHRCS